ncbi:MAG: hypothetical protein ACR2GK_05020 [Gemmatimonadaceae bacterium]
MKTVSRLVAAFVPLLLVATAEAQQRPPVRQLGAVTARSAETFTSVAGVRALSNGSVLVNDVAGRRVIQFDAALGSFKIVADSTSATANAYGGRTGSLLAYRGDSSIFVDPSSVSMLIVDPDGKVARVMAIPRAEDAGTIGSPMGNAAFDESGRLIYRASPALHMGGGADRVRIQATPGVARTGPPPMPDIPDSAFIFSVDLATRKVDTVGYIRTPKVKLDMQQTENGFRMQSMLNPLPVVDDWAVLPDGSVAIVRGRDYHVDFIARDGSTTSGAKIPFDWQRLTDEDKVAFLDSVKAARERLGANAPVPAAGAGAAPGMGGGGGPQVMVFSQTTGGPPPGGRGAVRAGAGNMQSELVYVPASDLPDYKPPFFAGSTRADTEGNLWIRTIPTSAIPGGPVYDVINRQGNIVERVQVPENRSIIGFGPDGAVYLLHRDGSTSALERASVS